MLTKAAHRSAFELDPVAFRVTEVDRWSESVRAVSFLDVARDNAL